MTGISAKSGTSPAGVAADETSLPKKYVCVVEPHQDRIVLDGEYIHISYLRSILANARGRAPAGAIMAVSSSLIDFKNILIDKLDERRCSDAPAVWESAYQIINAAFDEASASSTDADKSAKKIFRDRLIDALMAKQEAGYSSDWLFITATASNAFNRPVETALLVDSTSHAVPAEQIPT